MVNGRFNPAPANLRELSRDIAAVLLADLKTGKTARIGGDTIEAAFDAAILRTLADTREQLVEMTTRRVVQGVSGFVNQPED